MIHAILTWQIRTIRHLERLPPPTSPGTAPMRTTVSSTQYDAARVADSGHLLITDSALTGERHGVSSSGGTAADDIIICVSGGSISVATGVAFNAEDTISLIVLKNGTTISAGSGNLLNVSMIRHFENACQP
ncbi:hypothetical protein [Cupriavidus sp. HMR-1]|uniref:hypothetical protein n=1 Tax=Cupriavidus sp. HMR-1 TaxID=1249621 RepID=UPI0012674253|nr:hypothetical protein [Cupriavidus sp. HMR-1]